MILDDQNYDESEPDFEAKVFLWMWMLSAVYFGRFSPVLYSAYGWNP